MKKTNRIERTLFSLLVVLLPAQIGKHFWPKEALVRGIRIDYLSPTLYATDVLIILLLVLWVKRLDLNQAIKSKAKGKIFLLKALAFLAVLSNLFTSATPAVTLYSWLRVAELALFFFYLNSSPQKVINALKIFLPIPIIYSSLIAIAQFIKRASVGGPLYWLGERTFSITTPGIAKTENLGRLILRPYATFPHPNALAGFILIALTLLAPFIFTKLKNQYPNKILPITFALGIATLLLTFSLSAWIAAMLLIILLISKKYKTKLLPITTLLLAVLAILIAAFPPEEQSINQRLATAKTAIVLFQKHPLIGVGLGNFIPALAKLDQSLKSFHSPFLYYQPVHNIYLLVVAETGLIGLLAFLWLISSALKKARQKKRFEVALALLGILLIGLVDHYWITLHQTRLLFTIVLALAWRKRVA
jgi:putative inorganic carbon (HCO3(-)) transporter